jgi:nitrite reductase/ring-hydroxylating ferredoxin subunit
MTPNRIVAGLVLTVIAVLATACAGPAAAQVPTSTPVATASPSAVSTITPTPTTQPASTATPTARTQPADRIRPKWITPQVSGGNVSIPLSEVTDNWNTALKLQASGVDDNFMAYVLDGQVYVRASICPPCRSKSFSLVKDTLVCDTCGTVFKAKTGAGISGACVKYPKASVSYTIDQGKVVMSVSDLVAAYQNTLKGV